MRIVIVGAGAVGSYLAEKLSYEGQDVVVIGRANVAYDVARTVLRQIAYDAARTAARMPGTLFAARLTPVPVQQNRIPSSATRSKPGVSTQEQP